MPRRTNSVPRYCKHKASGQAVVKIQGRTYYLGKWKSKASRGEYDRLVGDWIAGGQQSPAAQNDLTCVELVAGYAQMVPQPRIAHG